MNTSFQGFQAVKIGIAFLVLVFFQRRPVNPPVETHLPQISQVSSSLQRRSLSWNGFDLDYRNRLKKSQGIKERRLNSLALQSAMSQFSNDDVNEIVTELGIKKDTPLYKTLVNNELIPSFRALRIPDWLANPRIAIDKEEATQFYLEFLACLKEKKYDSSVQVEKHHILPKHAGGGDEPNNLISISPEDHVALHLYRYQALGEIGDQVAYLMRISDTNERARLRAQAAVLTNRLKKQVFFDPDWQSVQGFKGGKVSGKLNIPAQQEARSKVGKTYGQATGISNQSPPLKEILRRELHWVYEDGERFTTGPAKSAHDIITQLNSWRPSSIRNESSFYKVLHGAREKMYGWTLEEKKIVDTAISSEAGEGKGSPERSETSA